MQTNFTLAKKNIVWASASVISKLLIGFAISILIARSPYLHIEEVGQVLYAISLAVVISLFVDYGLDTYMIKELASKRSKKEEVRYFVGFRLFLSILVFCMFLIFMSFVDFTAQESFLTLLIVLSYMVSVLNRTYFAYFQSQHNFKMESIISFSGDMMLVCLVILSLYYIQDVVFIGYAYLGARLFSLLLIFIFSIKYKLEFLPKFSISKFKSYFKNSFSFGLLAILATTCIYLDTLLLRFLTLDNPETQVAYFQIAMQFVMAATLMPGIIGKGLLPILSSDNNHDTTYLKVNNILMSLGVFIATFVVIYSEELILFVYGEKYLAVSMALKIVGVVIAMRFGMMYNLIITIKGNNWFRVLGSITMLITGVIANIILVPLYGFEGSAVSSIIAHIAIWTVYFYVVHKMGLPVLLGWNIKKFKRNCTFIVDGRRRK